MSETGVDPPATGVWYDLEATTAEVLAILRLTEQDVDTGRIATIIPAEAERIDVEADRCEAIDGPPPPSQVQQALVQRSIDTYQRKAAAAGGFAAPVDSMRRQVLSVKERFGVS